MLCTLNRQEDTDMKLEIVFKDGRKETFDGVASFNVTEEQNASEKSNVARQPDEGERFSVNCWGINRNSFIEPRSDWNQEWTRNTILAALKEVDKHPDKYQKKFDTIIPKDVKGGGYTSEEDVKAHAKALGGHVANWVEQALVWAYKIDRGASWKSVCNDPDTAEMRRLIIWKDGNMRLVGGSNEYFRKYPASTVDDNNYRLFVTRVWDAVPLVVIATQ